MDEESSQPDREEIFRKPVKRFQKVSPGASANVQPKEVRILGRPKPKREDEWPPRHSPLINEYTYIGPDEKPQVVRVSASETPRPVRALEETLPKERVRSAPNAEPASVDTPPKPIPKLRRRPPPSPQTPEPSVEPEAPQKPEEGLSQPELPPTTEPVERSGPVMQPLRRRPHNPDAAIQHRVDTATSNTALADLEIQRRLAEMRLEPSTKAAVPEVEARRPSRGGLLGLLARLPLGSLFHS